MVADIPELKARDRFRGMARQDSPRGRDVKGPATPTTNTGLWKTRVIVRQHRVDYDATPVDAPEVLQLGNRMIYLVTRGHQRRAVLQGPAVVLHVRNFDALRFQRDSEIDHFADPPNIGAMHDRIDRERQAEPHDFASERMFALERAAIARNVIRGYGVGVLDRDLDVVEAGLPQIAHGARCDTDS